MIKTPIGEIAIIFNGQLVNYSFIPLKKNGKNYNVDGRFKIELETHENGENIVECMLKMGEEKILGYSESGEELAMISFQKGNTKLSIGTIGDINGFDYEYEFDRLRLKADGKALTHKIVFYVAWVTTLNELNDIQTWFAADPTIDN